MVARILLVLLLAAFSPWLHAAQPESPLVVVTHIDVVPQFTDQAVLLLKQYHHESLSDPGAQRIDVLQQVGRPNHFTVVEQWDSQSDYDIHVGASHTIQFRQHLGPMLGAPFDERPHVRVD